MTHDKAFLCACTSKGAIEKRVDEEMFAASYKAISKVHRTYTGKMWETRRQSRTGAEG